MKINVVKNYKTSIFRKFTNKILKDKIVNINNIKNLLNKDGYIFIATPFFYPIHKNISGGYSDYWRFSDDGLRVLFRDMKEIFMISSPCVILEVEDRDLYYENSDNCVSGYCCLFQNIS